MDAVGPALLRNGLEEGHRLVDQVVVALEQGVELVDDDQHARHGQAGRPAVGPDGGGAGLLEQPGPALELLGDVPQDGDAELLVRLQGEDLDVGEPAPPLGVGGEAVELQALLVVEQQHAQLVGRVAGGQGVDDVEQEVGLALADGAADEHVGVRGVLAAQRQRERVAPGPADGGVQGLDRRPAPRGAQVLPDEVGQRDDGAGGLRRRLPGGADRGVEHRQGRRVVGLHDGARGQVRHGPCSGVVAQDQGSAPGAGRPAQRGVVLDHEVDPGAGAHVGDPVEEAAELLVDAVGVVEDDDDGQRPGGLAVAPPQVEQVARAAHGDALGVGGGIRHGGAHGVGEGPRLGEGRREGGADRFAQRREGPEDAGDAGVEDEQAQVGQRDLRHEPRQDGEHQVLGTAGGALHPPVRRADQRGEGGGAPELVGGAERADPRPAGRAPDGVGVDRSQVGARRARGELAHGPLECGPGLGARLLGAGDGALPAQAALLPDPLVQRRGGRVQVGQVALAGGADPLPDGGGPGEDPGGLRGGLLPEPVQLGRVHGGRGRGRGRRRRGRDR